MDIALGARIREVRNSQRPVVLQTWLASEIGCSAQQVQKYETGENQIAFSRLCEIAHALDMDALNLIAPLFHRSAAASPDATLSLPS